MSLNDETYENMYKWYCPDEDSDGDEDFANRQRANDLINYMRTLEQTHQTVHEANIFSYELYSNRYLSNFDWGTGTLTQVSLEPVSQTTDNVILEVCNAILSEVGKARPKAKPINHGSSWKSRQQARKLDKFLWGAFVQNDIYESIGKPALLNAEVCSFGCAKVECVEVDGNSHIKLHNIFPDNILIDQKEVVATGKIWHIVERRVLPVEVVASEWGVDIDEVRQSAVSLDRYVDYRSTGKDYVVIGEAYKIGHGDTPGRHVVAINNMLLLDEEWNEDFVPYVFFHFTRALTGFYGQSAVEQLLPDQIRLNEINEVIEKAQKLVSVPRILAQQGSGITAQSLSNNIGDVLYWRGSVKPESVTWPAIHAELYNEREIRKRNAFTKMGVQQAAAGGSLPSQARLDSAPAVRELNRVQDGRLADITQRYEKFFLDIAMMMIKVVKASGTHPTTVWYSGGKKSRAEVIDWKKIEIDEFSYTMVLEAASSFSMTPSAIRDDLETKMQRGEITKEEYAKQLSSPDPDNEITVLSAASDQIDYVQEQLEEGKFVPAYPWMDLLGAERRITLSLLNLDRYEDVPVEVREAHINFLESVKMWTEKIQEPPAPLDNPMPVTPSAMPGSASMPTALPPQPMM